MMKMRQYEIAVILNPDLDEAGVAAMTEKVDAWIAGLGGTVAHTEQKLKRRLAYPIRKNQEGHYVFWHAILPADGLHEIERNMRLAEEVLRFLFIRNDSQPKPETDTPQLEDGAVANETSSSQSDNAVDS